MSFTSSMLAPLKLQPLLKFILSMSLSSSILSSTHSLEFCALLCSVFVDESFTFESFLKQLNLVIVEGLMTSLSVDVKGSWLLSSWVESSSASNLCFLGLFWVSPSSPSCSKMLAAVLWSKQKKLMNRKLWVSVTSSSIKNVCICFRRGIPNTMTQTP